MDTKSVESIKSEKAIFTSTPEGLKSVVNPTGLYYRVKNKLEKLYSKVEDFEKNNNQGIAFVEDLEVVDRLMLKFERDNKISADDMKWCNELWRKYGNNK